MPSNNSTLNMFQRNLNEDTDLKSSYVNAENSDSEDSEDSECSETVESTNACKIIFPKSNRSKNKKLDTSQELLSQLIKQHQVSSNTQKKMYKLQSELDKEEITSRYIKLDLNNTQIKLEEYKEQLETSKQQLTNSKIENWTLRSVIFLYIIFKIYCLLYNFMEMFPYKNNTFEL